MAHDRAQLNALIFHNPVILPRTSPGFGEVSLAVAELQGGNYAKAAMFAEIGVGKDPALAAGWLAKAAADVFEATPSDLRTDRAIFCVERAMDCAPTCHREMIEFLVANIFGHYVNVLCASATEEVDQWMDHEFAAMRLEHEATLLNALGLAAALTALFSRRFGIKLFSGVASMVAFSEGARRERDAELLRALGSGHRTASLLRLVPARDLIALSAGLLRAEGLPLRPLDPVIHEFMGTFRHVFGIHLGWLQTELSQPIAAAIDGSTRALQAPRPGIDSTLSWVDQMLPRARELEAYQLLASPVPNILRLGGKGSATVERFARKAHGFIFAVCVFFLLLGIFGETATPAQEKLKQSSSAGYFVAFSSLSLFVGLSWFWTRRRLDRRARIHERFHSIWSVDAWLQGDSRNLFSENTVGDLRAPPETFGQVPRITNATKGLCFAAVAIGLLFWYIETRQDDPSTVNTSSAMASPAPSASVDPDKQATPKVRRATAVDTEPTTPAVPFSAAPVGRYYAVAGIADGDALNVHTGPGVSTSVSTKLANGVSKIEITGPSTMNGRTEWVPVRFGEHTGWVTKQYLKAQ